MWARRFFPVLAIFLLLQASAFSPAFANCSAGFARLSAQAELRSLPPLGELIQKSGLAGQESLLREKGKAHGCPVRLEI